MIASPPASSKKPSAYKIEYARGVIKDVAKLPKEIKQRAIGIIEQELAKDPFQGRPLTGRYRGLWKYRVGDYRIVYCIDHEQIVIVIVRIRHRKDVYHGIIHF